MPPPTAKGATPMTRFSVTQFLPGCVPSDPDAAAVFVTVAEARGHMATVAREASGDDPDGERQVITVNDNLVQVAWGTKGQGWYVEVAEVVQTDGSEDEAPDQEEPDDEWDHITGYSPRFIVMHSDASIEWTAADFD